MTPIPAPSKCGICEQPNYTYRLSVFDTVLKTVNKICSEECLKDYVRVHDKCLDQIRNRIKKMDALLEVIDMEVE